MLYPRPRGGGGSLEYHPKFQDICLGFGSSFQQYVGHLILGCLASYLAFELVCPTGQQPSKSQFSDQLSFLIKKHCCISDPKGLGPYPTFLDLQSLVFLSNENSRDQVQSLSISVIFAKFSIIFIFIDFGAYDLQGIGFKSKVQITKLESQDKYEFFFSLK